MPKQASRVPNKARSSQAPLNPMEILLDALNGETLMGKRTRKDVDKRVLLVFVRRFQQLEKTLAEVDVTLPIKKVHELPEVERCFQKLNRLFGRYRLVPVIIPTLRDTTPLWGLIFGRLEQPQPFAEFAKVQAIERIATEGRIQSLKQCSQCHRWLYARFSHQRFCSETCKEAFHRSNPDDKQRRRDWARHNYQLHKTKNVK